MSSPPKPTSLSADAQEDYINIIAYTKMRWGNKQAAKYDRIFHRAMDLISIEPGYGRPFQTGGNHFYSYLAGSHRFVYQIDTSQIRVIRILHQSMDLGRHLPSA